MFETLFSKVFFILSIQLIITFFTTYAFIGYCRKAYKKGEDWVELEGKENGELNLRMANTKGKKALGITTIALSVILFITLMVTQEDVVVAMIVFGLWSIVTGMALSLVLLETNENLGVLVIGITASITFSAALIGMYSGIDFSFMEGFLFIALVILIGLNILRMFTQMDGAKTRAISFFGVLLFTIYLIVDFNKITTNENDWESAMRISIHLYLDIINLFLDLLSLMSSK